MKALTSALYCHLGLTLTFMLTFSKRSYNLNSQARVGFHLVYLVLDDLARPVFFNSSGDEWPVNSVCSAYFSVSGSRLPVSHDGAPS